MLEHRPTLQGPAKTSISLSVRFLRVRQCDGTGVGFKAR